MSPQDVAGDSAQLGCVNTGSSHPICHNRAVYKTRQYVRLPIILSGRDI